MTYGPGVGTGALGASAAAGGIASGNMWLFIVACIVLLSAVVTGARLKLRTAADQRQ